ncbi:MAG: 2-C-methyl-D-erythritol 4-phosphate cytidylyltransferase [Erysipelotrichaceae bacterium]|nr:2-C-methyl-D-erythritol 4-phosphate cytidylyltransferase [Erysipelotrichaceae bacterium]
MKYDAIVVANGKGERANLGFNKVFYVMKNNKTVLENACSVFLNDEDCSKIIIVTEEENKVFNNDKVVVTKGGEQRANSVYNGLVLCESEYVFIHDGARPFLIKEDVDKLKEEVIKYDGVMLAKKATDTVKLVKDGMVQETINRNNIYLALTPQAFKTNLIKAAYETLDVSNCTDDASVFEKYNHHVKIVEGNTSNIKLTNAEDFQNI